MSDIHININNKTYATGESNEHAVISKLKLTLSKNEFVCLVGPSGCGKTTLLNIIANLDSQYQGKIELGESSIKPSIGFIFQEPRLLPWRTVRENIDLVLGNHQPDMVDSLLEVMQLTDIQHRYPEHLSLGMSRRVSIIRAFAINPSLLLMDEPFVSLDTPTARQISALLIQLWQKRPHTILFVTHDLREAITLADRIVFLSSSPMSVIKEIAITIPRANRDNEAEIETFRQHLLSQHSEIQTLL